MEIQVSDETQLRRRRQAKANPSAGPLRRLLWLSLRNLLSSLLEFTGLNGHSCGRRTGSAREP